MQNKALQRSAIPASVCQTLGPQHLSAGLNGETLKRTRGAKGCQESRHRGGCGQQGLARGLVWGSTGCLSALGGKVELLHSAEDSLHFGPTGRGGLQASGPGELSQVLWLSNLIRFMY